MKCFEVKFVRAECYIEQMRIRATTVTEAESLANEMLENGDVSFDHSEVSDGTEYVTEVTEIEQSATVTLDREQLEALAMLASHHELMLTKYGDGMPRSEWRDEMLLNNEAHQILRAALT
jgi:hypothetical protein